jgi:diphosphomevalonate decarboxylase
VFCGPSSASNRVFDTNQTALASQIAPETHWDLVDLVVVVDAGPKTVTSSQGHLLAETSPYYHARLKEIQPRIDQVRQAIVDKNLQVLGPLLEAESTSMHLIMMTSQPPIYYWQPGSIEIMQRIRQWRGEGLEAYFTLDAGANVHVICSKAQAPEVQARLQKNSFVKQIIPNHPAPGAHFTNTHLF